MKAFVLLGIALFVLGQAGNIIRFCDAHPVAIAFYRLLFAFILITPVAIYKVRFRYKELSLKHIAQVALMGIFFALHFFTWITAIQNTTVANAAICLSISPVFTALGARFIFGERVTRGLIVAMILGTIGVALTGWGSVSFDLQNLNGDLISVLSGLFFSLYFLSGKSLQDKSEYFLIMPFVYFFAAIFSGVVLLVMGIELSGISTTTWTALGVLTIFPTIIGHGSLIYALKKFKASTVSTLTLAEPALAAIGAYILFGESVSNYAYLGYAFIVIGMVCLFNKRILASS